MSALNKSRLTWIFFNGVFAACVYLGFYNEIQGAKNVAVFIGWLTSIVGLFVMQDDVIKSIKKKGLYIPFGIDYIFDTAIIVVFIWHEYFFLGSAYLLHMIMLYGAREKAFSETES